MPSFKYTAVSNDGHVVSGIVEAYDEFEAIDQIKQSNRVVHSIKEVDSTRPGLLQMNIGAPKILEKELALMCSQFAIVTKAGMPIVRAVEMIAGQTSKRHLKHLLRQVAEDVAAGYGLAQSFENKGADLLPTTFIETIRAGEESGSLEVSFDKLFHYFDKSSKTKSKVKGAMMYPVFLSVLAVIVISIILVAAMPVFIGIFDGSGQQLPGPTRLLIAMSGFMSKYWVLMLAVVLAVYFALKHWSRTEKGRMFFAELQLKLPVLGHVARMKGASQLANTMATMLAAGLPIIRAVSVCAKVMDNYCLSYQLGLAIAGLEQGKELGACMKELSYFPELLVEMTSVGEETGTLETTLETIGAYYDSETAIASERALNLLQPAITVVMGLVIGFIVIALYLPMFGMYNNI